MTTKTQKQKKMRLLMLLESFMQPPDSMPKTRINISLNQDLADFAKVFAVENRTSVADRVSQYLLTLKRRIEGRDTESILSHPAFQEAMELAQAKLKDGSA